MDAIAIRDVLRNDYSDDLQKKKNYLFISYWVG